MSCAGSFCNLCSNLAQAPLPAHVCGSRTGSTATPTSSYRRPLLRLLRPRRLSSSSSSSSSSRDKRSFDAALMAAAAGGNWLLAVSLLSTMSDAGLRGDVQSSTHVMAACRKASKWGLGLQVFEDSLKGKSVEVDLAAVSMAIGLCSLGGRWAEAVHLLFSFSFLPPDAAANAKAKAKAREKDASQKEIDASLRKTRWLDLKSFMPALAACSKAQEWSQALQLLTDMDSRDVRADRTALEVVLGACDKAAQWDAMASILSRSEVSPSTWKEALACLLRSTTSTPSAGVVAEVMRACGREQAWASSLHLLWEFQSRYSEQDKLTLAAVVGVTLGQASQWQQALALLSPASILNNTLDRGIGESIAWNDMAVVNSVLRACRKSTQWEIVCSLFKIATQGPFQLSPDAEMHTSLLRSLAIASQWESGLKLWESLFNNWDEKRSTMEPVLEPRGLADLALACTEVVPQRTLDDMFDTLMLLRGRTSAPRCSSGKATLFDDRTSTSLEAARPNNSGNSFLIPFISGNETVVLIGSELEVLAAPRPLQYAGTTQETTAAAPTCAAGTTAETQQQQHQQWMSRRLVKEATESNAVAALLTAAEQGNLVHAQAILLKEVLPEWGASSWLEETIRPRKRTT
mmetsp:Transcript_76981/g.160189  ORF Transcript_76981/g.160189 Transcript_76981/m.160189 type:complete len:632 (+) Transcript_76981:579-2474(+)